MVVLGGGQFLMSEVPLYADHVLSSSVSVRLTDYRGTSPIRKRTPLGPPYVPRHSPSVGSWGVAVSYERGTPVFSSCHSGFVAQIRQLQSVKGPRSHRRGETKSTELELALLMIMHRVTSPIRKRTHLGLYSRCRPRALR